MSKLAQKYELYKQLIVQQQDEYGFIDHKYCDATLFTGLAGCVTGVDVNMWAAFDPEYMMWHRRPLDKPCYNCGDEDPKGSTISRDMLMGLLWYSAFNVDRAMVDSIVFRAITRFGFMGCAGSLKVLLTKCQIMPPLFVTALLLRNKLRGGRWYDRFLEYIPADFGPVKVGYQAHLQVLHIMLRSIITGYISPGQLKKLEQQAARMPRNALFQLAVGNTHAARKILEDESLFPADRLPAAKDRKESWLWQRDSDDSDGDWEPSKKNEVHHGGDFLFAYWLLEILENK